MEINIKEMSAAKWRKLRESLDEQITAVDGYRTARITRVDPTIICIEGCGVPICFNIETGVMTIWNKCSRYSSGYRSMDTLRKIETILQTWSATVFELEV